MRLLAVLAVAAVAASFSHALPIRTMAVLDNLPLHMIYSNYSPCNDKNLTASKSCRGGFAWVASWFRYLSNGTRGTVKFTLADDRSGLLQQHPLRWSLNLKAWEYMKVDFNAVKRPKLLTEDIDHNALVDFLLDTKPLVSNFDFEKRAYLFDIVRRYVVKEIDGVKFGYLGIWSEHQYVATIKHADIIPEITRRMRKEGVEVIMTFCLDQGYTQYELEALAQFDTDVVVFPINIHDGVNVSTTFVNGTQFYKLNHLPYYVTVIDSEKTPTGWTFDFRQHSLWSSLPNYVEPDLDAFRWLEEQIAIAEANNPVIATSTVELTTDTYPVCVAAECMAGNLGTDAIVADLNDAVDVALINGGGFRKGWPAGNITTKDITELFPYANTVCTFNTTGPGLWRMLEHGLRVVRTDDPSLQGKGSFPQVSGVKLVYNINLPENERIISLSVLNRKTGVYEPVSRTRTYVVAMSSFVCQGGDGYRDALTKIPGTQKDYSSPIGTIIVEYLQRNTPYTPRIEGRVVKQSYGGPPLKFVELVAENCTNKEKYLPQWHACQTCPEGMWHPSPGDHDCVPIPVPSSSSVNYGLIVGVVAGVLVLLAIPVVWKLTENKRRIAHLFNVNKVAEESAAAIAKMQLEDLDYLDELENPNKIQASFIAIRNNLKMYRDFIPNTALVQSDDGEGEDDNPTDSSTARSSKSSSTLMARHHVNHLKNGLRSKPVTVLAVNMQGFMAKAKGASPEFIIEFHGQYIETLLNETKKQRGVAEPFCGDRMMICWNTVVTTQMHKCKACACALGISQVYPTLNIGISSGQALVGNIGAGGMKRFTVVSYCISTAHLLMVLNKDYETNILIDDKVYSECSYSYYASMTDRVMTKNGKVDAWCLRDSKVMSDQEWMYQQQEALENDPYAAANNAWHSFLTGGAVAVQSAPDVLRRLLNSQTAGVDYARTDIPASSF